MRKIHIAENSKMTPEIIETYKSIQESGVMNMFNTKLLSQLSGIPVELVKLIYKDYENYVSWAEFCKKTRDIEFERYIKLKAGAEVI